MSGGRIIFRNIASNELKSNLITGQYALGFTNDTLEFSKEGAEPVPVNGLSFCDSNTFLGINSGSCNTTGVSNTFIGATAGFSNTVGFQNVFIGSLSGCSNTTGVSNTFIGVGSGINNTTGNYNTFIGWNSGSTTSGLTSSIAIGACAVPQADGEIALGSVSYPILLSSTDSGPSSCNLVIRINGTCYKIALLNP